jgi:hypothetical protein
MERSIEQMKEVVFQFDGDLTAEIFGVEIEAQSIVDDYKWMIEKIERYETALKEISQIHNYDGFKAKDIARIALED